MERRTLLKVLAAAPLAYAGSPLVTAMANEDKSSTDGQMETIFVKSIVITLNSDGKVRMETIPDLFPGDAARLTTNIPGAVVKAEFVTAGTDDFSSPFGANPIDGSGIHIVEHKGDFIMRCYLKLEGGHQFIGWDDDPGAGGEMPIPPR